MASFLKIPETVSGVGGVAAAKSTHNTTKVVGRRTHNNVAVRFVHPACGTLIVNTGIDKISWGYTLNTANFPTYGGEVIQILSCHIEDMRLQGTLASYPDLDAVYNFFLKFIDNASAEGTRDETPMKFYYDQRGWEFDLFVKNAPGFRKSRDVVAPEWMIEAHVVDTAGHANSLKDLIIEEVGIKAATGDLDANFGLQGKIRYIDENPFSDPNTREGNDFKQFDRVADYYTKLLPSYLSGDVDALFGEVGSKPSFDPSWGVKGNTDGGDAATETVQRAERSKGNK